MQLTLAKELLGGPMKMLLLQHTALFSGQLVLLQLTHQLAMEPDALPILASMLMVISATLNLTPWQLKTMSSNGAHGSSSASSSAPSVPVSRSSSMSPSSSVTLVLSSYSSVSSQPSSKASVRRSGSSGAPSSVGEVTVQALQLLTCQATRDQPGS